MWLAPDPPIEVLRLPYRARTTEFLGQPVRRNAFPDLGRALTRSTRGQCNEHMGVVVHDHGRQDGPEHSFASRDDRKHQVPFIWSKGRLRTVEPPCEADRTSRILPVRELSPAGQESHPRRWGHGLEVPSPISCEPVISNASFDPRIEGRASGAALKRPSPCQGPRRRRGPRSGIPKSREDTFTPHSGGFLHLAATFFPRFFASTCPCWTRSERVVW